MKTPLETWTYVLLTNGILLYGVIALAWPIFPFVYLWWWEGLLGSAVGIFLAKRAGHPSARWSGLLLYAVYFIFIVVFLGVLAAGEEQVIFNLSVTFLKEPLFNLCLLLLVLHLGYRVLNSRQNMGEVFLRQLRIHAGIVLGGLAMFVSKQLELNNVLPVALTVLALKIALDIWTVLSDKTSGDQST